MLPRVFVDGVGAVGKSIEIDGEDGHHYARVLRVKAGEPLVVAMNNGPWYGEIAEVGNREIRVQLSAQWRSAEPNVQVTVVQSVAKGDKMETIVQKCTEVGAFDFVVYEAERSVSRIGNKLEAKRARWQKMSREAAMQSQRDIIPQIRFEENISNLCNNLKSQGVQHMFILDEDETSISLQKALGNIDVRDGKKFAIFVGPEGGITDAERAAFQNTEMASLVTIGPRILRTETAGLVALTMILAEYGDMGG